MGLPLQKVRVYKFKEKLGKTKKVRYVMAETLKAARNFLKKKGVRLVGNLRFYKTILIVSDMKKVEPKLASKGWIEKGP